MTPMPLTGVTPKKTSTTTVSATAATPAGSPARRTKAAPWVSSPSSPTRTRLSSSSCSLSCSPTQSPASSDVDSFSSLASPSTPKRLGFRNRSSLRRRLQSPSTPASVSERPATTTMKSPLAPSRPKPKVAGSSGGGKLSGSANNPLKSDPVLIQLLDRLDAVDSFDQFDTWKEEFLNQFETYLGDSSKSEEASAAYQTFRDNRMENIVKRVKRAATHVDDGSLSTDRVSVRARNNMNELSVGLQATGKDVRALAPPTTQDEYQCGYSKYHMGAVLVRDGFQEYERLTVCNDILRRLKDTCIDDIGDDKLLGAMVWYNESISQFVTVMEDLGLYQIMLKCQEFDPKKRPRDSKPKEPAPPEPQPEEVKEPEPPKPVEDPAPKKPEPNLNDSVESLEVGDLSEAPDEPVVQQAPTTPNRKNRKNYDVSGNWGSMSFSDLPESPGRLRAANPPGSAKKKQTKKMKKKKTEGKSPDKGNYTPSRKIKTKSRKSDSNSSLPKLDLDDLESSSTPPPKPKGESNNDSKGKLTEDNGDSPSPRAAKARSQSPGKKLGDGNDSKSNGLNGDGAPPTPRTAKRNSATVTVEKDTPRSRKEKFEWKSISAKPRMAESHAAAKKAAKGGSSDGTKKVPRTPKKKPPKLPPKAPRELKTKTEGSRWSMPMDLSANPDEVWNRKSKPIMRPRKSKTAGSSASVGGNATDDDESINTARTEPVIPPSFVSAGQPGTEDDSVKASITVHTTVTTTTTTTTTKKKSSSGPASNGDSGPGDGIPEAIEANGANSDNEKDGLDDADADADDKKNENEKEEKDIDDENGDGEGDADVDTEKNDDQILPTSLPSIPFAEDQPPPADDGDEDADDKANGDENRNGDGEEKVEETTKTKVEVHKETRTELHSMPASPDKKSAGAAPTDGDKDEGDGAGGEAAAAEESEAAKRDLQPEADAQPAPAEELASVPAPTPMPAVAPRVLETIGALPTKPESRGDGAGDGTGSVVSEDDYTYVECEDDVGDDDEVTVSTELYEAMQSEQLGSDGMDDDSLASPKQRRSNTIAKGAGPPKSIEGLPPRPPRLPPTGAPPPSSSSSTTKSTVTTTTTTSVKRKKAPMKHFFHGNEKPVDEPEVVESTEIVDTVEENREAMDEFHEFGGLNLSVRRLTFCSVDDSVDPKLLGILSMCYPLVEWAVLLRPDKMGQPRYASLDWMQQLSAVAGKSGGEMKLAAHLCGSLVDDLLRGDDAFLSRLPDMGFQRVQINATAINGVDTYQMDKYASNVLKIAQQHRKIELIVQQNEETRPLWEAMLAVGGKKLPYNVTMLVDESKGRGVMADGWKKPPPRSKYHIGYAGGIGLGGRSMTKMTFQSILKARDGKPVWVSMETSLRSTVNGKDMFDISKCYQIIDAATQCGIHLHPNFVA